MPEPAASNTPLPLPPLLNKQELSERLSVPEQPLENRVKADEFPPPVRIGKHVFWFKYLVRQWYATLFSAQENWRSQMFVGRGTIALPQAFLLPRKPRAGDAR